VLDLGVDDILSLIAKDPLHIGSKEEIREQARRVTLWRLGIDPYETAEAR
jgi:hypothetical protein